MATIRENDKGYVYDDNGFEIPLNQSNFCGFMHRLGEYAMMDLVSVEDPRDGLKFTHWRYSQPQEVFDQMFSLVYKIGTFMVRDTPLEDIENTFMNLNGPRDDETS